MYASDVREEEMRKGKGGKKDRRGNSFEKFGWGGREGGKKKRRKEKKRIAKRAMIGRRDGKRGRGKKTVARTAG